MLFRFASPTLPRLDDLDLEVIAAAIPSDIRPWRGVVGLCDFRMGARLSKLAMNGDVSGKLGEVVMVPGKPFLSFDKVVLFGCGPVAGLSEPIYASLLHDMAKCLGKLKVRVAAVELPGRAYGAVTPQLAAEVLIREVGHSAECDQWTLVEDGEGRSVIEALLFEQRRRLRRDPATG
jgi:hypothetical protein